MIREKNTRSGKLFEADFYPVWNDGRSLPRAPKSKRSTPEQERYNKRQAEKNLIRLVNVNFDEYDNILHPTYEPEHAPQSIDEARRDIRNQLRRLKNRRKSELKKAQKIFAALPDNEILRSSRLQLQKKIEKLKAPFKYIYVIERVQYKTGKYAGRNNWHFHLFVTGGIDRKDLESMWPHGMRTNADRFQPDRYGPEAIAKYMSKAPQGSKRFCCSRNLDKPKESRPKDGRITPRGVERMARERSHDAEYWERRYKGYRFLRCYSRYNEYNGHWYVSVVMYKSDGGDIPRWEYDDWLEE